MSQQVAKLFTNGRSQAVRLPAAFRFDDVKEVFVRQDPQTGDIILSRKPPNWDGFVASLPSPDETADFLTEVDRKQASDERDPFEAWSE